MTPAPQPSIFAPGSDSESPPSQPLLVRDPATGDRVGEVVVSDRGAIEAAVGRAAAARRAWAALPMAERSALLDAWAARLEDNADELARLITLEMGKPIGDALGGVEAGIGAIRQYSQLAPLHRGQRLNGDPGAVDTMERVPRGVAAILLPWNDPVALACAQISACALMGNTVVVKPSERAPLAVARAVQLLPDQLHRGVVELVQGEADCGRALVASHQLDLVLHTGSTDAGREVAVVCATQLRKAIVELGGKDALIVDGDVDPAWAADQAALGAFANAGQLCVSVERILVDRGIAQPFLDALVSRAASLRLGHGLDPDTEMGPLVDARHRASVHRQVVEAVDAGATLLAGGALPDGPGAFYPPTVLTDVRSTMSVWTDETFGPVAPVMVVDDFEEALEAADATSYGLAATVLTRSETNARRAVRALDVGTVKINGVFGGAPGGAAEPSRQSGLGIGYGPELLDEVSAWKVAHFGA